MPARSILWPDPSVKPPVGTVAIDRSHPIAPIGYWPTHEGAGIAVLDLAGVRPATFIEPAWAPSTAGVLVNHNGTTQYGRIPYQAKFDFAGGGPFTLSVLGHWGHTFADADCSLFAMNNGVGSYDGWMFYLNSTSGLQWFVNGAARISKSSIVAGYHRATVTDDGTTQRMYLDGIEVGNVARVVPANQACDLILGAYYSGGNDTGGTPSNKYNHLAGEWLIANRGWTASEVLQHAIDPYCFLRPIIRRRYFVATAGAGATQTRRLIYRGA